MNQQKEVVKNVPLAASPCKSRVISSFHELDSSSPLGKGPLWAGEERAGRLQRPERAAAPRGTAPSADGAAWRGLPASVPALSRRDTASEAGQTRHTGTAGARGSAGRDLVAGWMPVRPLPGWGARGAGAGGRPHGSGSARAVGGVSPRGGRGFFARWAGFAAAPLRARGARPVRGALSGVSLRRSAAPPQP